jgi:proline iminopeptidase
LTYAATYADHVAGVIYLNGVGIGDWHTPYYAERARRMTPEQAARLDDLTGRKRTADEETEFRVLSWFTDHADRDQAVAWARASAAVDLPINFAANRVLSAEINNWSDDHVAGLAASIPAPITFIHGDSDPRPASAVRALAAHAREHTFHLIPGAGHSPWLEQPELVREVLRSAVQ